MISSYENAIFGRDGWPRQSSPCSRTNVTGLSFIFSLLLLLFIVLLVRLSALLFLPLLRLFVPLLLMLVCSWLLRAVHLWLLPLLDGLPLFLGPRL